MYNILLVLLMQNNYLLFRYTEVITIINLVFPSHHTKLLNVQYSITDSSHRAVHYIPMTSILLTEFCIFFFVCFGLFWAASTAYEVPRLGVESELQLPTYFTATVSPDLSHTCDLHHSSWQHCILNPLSEDKDRTLILMDTSWVCYHWSTMELSGILYLLSFFTHFCPPSSPAVGSHQYLLWNLSFVCFVVLFLKVPHVNDIICLFLT